LPLPRAALSPAAAGAAAEHHGGHPADAEETDQIPRGEVVCYWHRAGDHAEEPIDLGLPPGQGGEQRLPFDPGRAEGGQLGGELVHGQRRLVPGLLITGQRGGDRPGAP